MQYALAGMGPRRSLPTPPKLNHVGGFDCNSCDGPDPNRAYRKTAEFCENGAKAIAWEATRRRVDVAFFAAHPVAELRQQDDHRLERNGRPTEPKPGETLPGEEAAAQVLHGSLHPGFVGSSNLRGLVTLVSADW